MGEEDIWWERMRGNKIRWDGMRWEKMKGKAMREIVISLEERWWIERRRNEKCHDVMWEDKRRDVKWNDLKWGDEMTRHGIGRSQVNMLWGKMTWCDQMTWAPTVSAKLGWSGSGGAEAMLKSEMRSNEFQWDFKIIWEDELTWWSRTTLDEMRWNLRWGRINRHKKRRCWDEVK